MNNKVTDMQDFINRLGNNKFTGYIWMVEEKEPRIYIEKTIDFNRLNELREKPFNKIQEAYLSDGTHSVHIKNIDGEEKVFVLKYDEFTEDNDFDVKEITLPSHIDGIEELHFLQVYKKTESEVSTGFSNWIPVVKLFNGINEKIKNI